VPKSCAVKPVAKRPKRPTTPRVPASRLVLVEARLMEVIRERDSAYALNLELTRKLEALSRRSLVQRILNRGV